MSEPKLLVDTNSGDPENSHFTIMWPDHRHFNVLTEQAQKGLGIQFTTTQGAEVYVPHHAITSIEYHPGDKA